jgi:hypothetical protein
MTLTTYLLENQGQFQTDISGDLLKLFGRAKYSPQQQQIDPTEPRTRVVKDVIRVGRWKVGPNQYETFSAARLIEVVRCFQEAKSRGYEFNLCKTHGKKGQVHPDDFISPIDDLRFDGKTLWATVYVTPEQRKYLKNPAMKTSPGLFPNWVDGRGKKYGCQMVHLAVTDTPVVSGQGRFITLANEQGTAMDFAALVELLNALLKKTGSPALPDDVSEETLMDSLKAIVEAMADPESEDDKDGKGEMPMEMANQQAETAKILDLIQMAVEKIGEMDGKLVTMSNEQTAIKKDRYADRVAELLGEGRITAGQRDALVKDGESVRWDLSNLQEFASRPALYRSARFSAGLATDGEPDVDGVAKTKTTERIQQLAGLLAPKK